MTSTTTSPIRPQRGPLRHLAARLRDLVMRSGALPGSDPTTYPPPGYTRRRAKAVHVEAFRRCFEYLNGTQVVGHVLEFGTLRGYTARVMAGLISDLHYPGSLYLYDSFEGLPPIHSDVDLGSYEVSVRNVWYPGQMDVRETHGDISARIRQSLTKVLPAGKLTIVKGFYEDTLPHSLPEGKAALVHIDCDLYASTKWTLSQIVERGMLQDGCVLVLDDYNCNRANPNMGERRALREAFAEQDRFSYSEWFSYGWHGQVMFVHDHQAAGASPPTDLQSIGTNE